MTTSTFDAHRTLLALLVDLHPDITGLDVRPWPGGSNADPAKPVTAAGLGLGRGMVAMLCSLGAAARSAGHASRRTRREVDILRAGGGRLEGLKKEVDAAATSAGEEVLLRSGAPIVVRAGEGARDNSPGARLDQMFGAGDTASEAVIDYVDGTLLAARGLDNALSLGAIGDQVRRTPDLKAFAVLAPRALRLPPVLLNTPAAAAEEVARRMVKLRPGSPTAVLTHSRDAGIDQEPWYSLMQGLFDRVEIPDPVSVEPPFLIAPARSRGVDCVIGVMGLVELVFAALLCDLHRPHDELVFRLAGKTSGKDLLGDPVRAFALNDSERQRAHAAGLAPDQTFRGDDFVGPGTSKFAGMFAVTDCPALDLVGAADDQVDGLVFSRRGGWRVRLRFEDRGPVAAS